ncbi:uncharacterized protein K452DRAFT_282864 [Aplosporella prunicola CBS 121167]|uniref:Uncharacterized protein n=1 Tax=Aplosporella prunicola CBS 121167 TaxID=1176127 RepID=A0A6A6BTT9_9PEZI|nr:uncharacterized protein K452DRAFT_282864 [Aplosporella prunicola CBS 121167]KAF2146685.1 hypothetical protein K452DRAFT_282864 [Aplosporella prunicola CBS 121167]
MEERQPASPPRTTPHTQHALAAQVPGTARAGSALSHSGSFAGRQAGKQAPDKNNNDNGNDLRLKEGSCRTASQPAS